MLLRCKWLSIVVLALVSQLIFVYGTDLKPLSGIDQLKKIDQVVCSISPIAQVAFVEANKTEAGKFNGLVKTGGSGAQSLCWKADQFQQASPLTQARHIAPSRLWLLNRALLL